MRAMLLVLAFYAVFTPTTTLLGNGQSGEQAISPVTTGLVKEMMSYNVGANYGTENFPGLSVCAKSGTAEVGGDRKPNAMFTGFVADEKYPLAFIVAVEDGGYGRKICVPILSKVLAACKELLDS